MATNFLGSIVQRWQRTNLVIRIFSGIALGTILALISPNRHIIATLGTLFVGSLKAIAPILVAVLVASSIANARDGVSGRFKSVIVLYMLTTLIAAILSVIMSNLFPVSITLSHSAANIDAAPAALSEVFDNLICGIISNPVTAIIEGNYLSILFWAIVVGLALKGLASPSTTEALQEWADAISRVVYWIIQFAPFGILGLVYHSVSNSGIEIYGTYSKLLLLLAGTMLVVALIVNPAIIAIILKRNPYPLVWHCLKESGVSAFFTRSSAANIPVNMEICRRLGINKDFYSVSIPLGSTINMNGAAITITIMTLATCHTLGIEVPLYSALILSIVATLAACGSSGVAGGSLLLIPMACSLFGISNDIASQVIGVGFIISVIQDSMETALNSSGDVMFTITAELRERLKRNESIDLFK